MRKLLLIIICVIVAISTFMSVYGHQAGDAQPDSESYDQSEVEDMDSGEWWIDTVMYAKGHSFGYSGDVSVWGGWYFDTIFVGNNIMLCYDSIGPAIIKLDLITRQTTIDLGSRDAVQRIKRFLGPIEGFRHYQKNEVVCFDSIMDEKYGLIKNIGHFSFAVDYADTCNPDADRLNRFMLELVSNSGNMQVDVPPLTAFFIGYRQPHEPNRSYSRETWNIDSLVNYVLDNTIDSWKRIEDYHYESSMGSGLAVDAHIATSKFATFSVYEYNRVGIGHGMYTETFHTFDMKNGTELSNDDIFKPRTLDKVKTLLFEVMAKDPKYSEWNQDITSASDVQARIEGWREPNPLLDGTEWEEPKKTSDFILPEGALTDSGIVFSFQPYEIGCWAEGAYHFIVPYEKLRPYLTSRIKELIKS